MLLRSSVVAYRILFSELTCLLVFLARLHWTREDYVKHNQGGEATTRFDDGWSAFFEDKFCWGTIKGLDIYARKTDKMLLHERYLKEVILVLRAEYEFFQGRLGIISLQYIHLPS